MLSKISELNENKVNSLLTERDKIAADIFKQHPFKTPKVSSEEILALILDSKTFSSGFDL